MFVRVLGCSGSIAAGNRTTAFLLDHDVLVDAGTGVGDLDLDEMVRIDHIVLSHSHLDHVLGIPLLADSVMRRRLQAQPFKPVTVHALPQTLQALRTHLFNDVLWPDFTRLPASDRPILKLEPLAVGQTLELGGKRLEVLPAVHTVPAIGVAVHTPRGDWVYTGDTGPNPALWATLRGRRIAQLVIETAFGDDERNLAEISLHLSPALLVRELEQLAGPASIGITHIKPGEAPAVMGQIAALQLPHEVRALVAGDRFEF